MTDWSKNVDEKLQQNLMCSAKECLSNGSEILKESKLLLEKSRFNRAIVLAILAEEEFAKTFILHMSALNGRWDSKIYRSLTQHQEKQGIMSVLYEYIKWFKSENEYAMKMKESSLIPVPIKQLPDDSLAFRKWAQDAKDEHLNKKVRDNQKQNLLYVSVHKDGSHNRTDTNTQENAIAEIENVSFMESAMKDLVNRNHL